MAMAYGGKVKVSDAAKKVIGPDDPKARAEVEEERDQEFDVWDQIGLASDMLPGGAIAAGGAKAAAAGGRNIYKMINDSITGFKTGGAKSAKDAVLKWASSTDLTILTDAMNYLDGLSGKALAEVEPVRKAINDVYNQFSAPKGGFSLGAKPEGVKASKATTDVMATKDLPASTRMSKDMPSPSGKGRVGFKGKEGLEDISSHIEEFSSLSDDQLMYWIELEGKMKPMNASTAQRQKEKLGLLMQEAKKRGIDDTASTIRSSSKSRVSQEGLQDIKDVRSLDDEELLNIYDEMKDVPFSESTTFMEFINSADEWDAFLRLMKNEIRDRGLF